MAPLVSRLKSLFLIPDIRTAPIEGTRPTVDIIAARGDAVTQSQVDSVDLDAGTNDTYVGEWLEAINGNCRGQFLMITDFSAAADLASTTFHKESSGITTTQYRMWKLGWYVGKSTAGGAADGTTFISTDFNQADDFWNGYQLLLLRLGSGQTQDVKPIADFVGASGTFTLSPALKAQALSNGDIAVPGQCIQCKDLTIAWGGGDPIERDLTTDVLDTEGVLVGAMSNVTASMKMEVRSRASGGGDGAVAVRPTESHIWLDALYTQSLGTGDTVKTGSTATSVILETATARWAQYDLFLINGEAAGITAIAANTPAGDTTYTVPTGHLSAAPAATQVAFAGACYKPIDTGHGSCSLLAVDDDERFHLLSCGMPSHGIELQPNAAALHTLSWKFLLHTGWDDIGFNITSRQWDDLYDATAPVIVKGNVSRVVIGGVKFNGDVLSASFQLMPEPTNTSSAFGALENKNAYRYTTRQPTGQVVLYAEDLSYLHRYRALSEFDFLIQVGTVAGRTLVLWAPRAQIVTPPEQTDTDGFMTQTLSLRFLRPSTQSQPSYVMGLL